MMKIRILSIVIIIFLLGCTKSEIKSDISECIEKKIKLFSSDNNYCNNASVREYRFQNKMVYVFDVGNCGADISAPVIDNNCNNLGFLGGISGNGIINGESFSNAKYLRTIWSK